MNMHASVGLPTPGSAAMTYSTRRSPTLCGEAVAGGLPILLVCRFAACAPARIVQGMFFSQLWLAS
jgi:hypothetical protein